MKIHKWICFYALFTVCVFLTSCGSKNAGDLYRDGLKCMDGGGYEEAAKYFNMAIQKNGERAEYYIAYGMALIELGSYEEARNQLDVVIRDKDSRIVKENNKHAYRGKGIAFLREGLYEQADLQFEEALNIKELPELDEDVIRYQAEAKQRLGDWEGALLGYDRLIDKNAKEAAYYRERASIKVWMGDEEGALQDYDESVKRKSRNYEAMLAKYLLLKDLGRSEDAEETLTEVLSVKPKDRKEEFYLTVAKYFKGDTEGVMGTFHDMAEEGISEGLYYMALIHQENGEYEDAIDCFIKYQEENAGLLNVKFYNQILGCYMELKEYEEALAWIGKWADEGKTLVRRELLYNEIVLYERLANFDKAFDKANRYLERYPEDEVMKQELVFIQTRLSNKRKKALKKASHGEPSPTPAAGDETDAKPAETSRPNADVSPDAAESPDVTVGPDVKASPDLTASPDAAVSPNAAASPGVANNHDRRRTE